MTLQRRTALGRKPKARGNRAELEVVNILKARGFPAYRNFASGGYGGSDVIGLPGVSIEVKMVERLNIWAAIAQCKAAASPTDIAAVVFRRNRSEWMTCIPFEDFLGLLEAAGHGARVGP